MTSSYAEQARARKKADALQSGIDDAFISQLVERFYDAVRNDDLIGPIFAERISDWPHHLARMKEFWASIMLESGRYSGNPMRKHVVIAQLDDLHFARWQSLWHQTLAGIAPSPAVTERFREAALRIGESLLMGIRIHRDGLASISTRASA